MALHLDQYLAYKEMERFLDSLMTAKPLPHFVVASASNRPKNQFGLERVASFLRALGDPHLRHRYIHIAGTSGKTSTAYFAASLLTVQGYRTGLFTSPHICTSADYFMIDGRLPPVKELLELVNSTKAFVDHEYEQSHLGLISHFEYILSLALEYFFHKQVDYVVLEAGLGGRTDATNVIRQAEVSIITNIGLDHTNILGNTVPEIATEKLGIIKAGCPLVTAEKNAEVLGLFHEEARKFGVDVHVLGRDFAIEQVESGLDATTFDYRSDRHTYRALSTPMRGAYQAENAALAIRALELLATRNGTPIDEEALRNGLATTFIPGRYEQVQEHPVVILDGAHNPDKIARLAAYLQSRFTRDEVIVVCGLTTGKQPEQIVRLLHEVSAEFYFTRVITGYRESEEPGYLKSLLTALDSSAKVTMTTDPSTALDAAMEHAKRQGKVVCVTGSLYLVSYLRQRWYPEAAMLE